MTDILSLIASSFLSEKDKEALKSLFQSREADEAFFRTFNKLLIDELGRRGKEFQMSVEAFDRRSLEIEKQYHIKIEELEKELDHALAGLTPDDVVKKSELWKAYYVAVDAARTKYEEAMRRATSEVIKQAMS